MAQAFLNDANQRPQGRIFVGLFEMILQHGQQVAGVADGIGRASPALLRAVRIGRKLAKGTLRVMESVRVGIVHDGIFLGCRTLGSPVANAPQCKNAPFFDLV